MSHPGTKLGLNFLMGYVAAAAWAEEVDIDLADVPDEVMAAAKAAVPGLEIEEAERVTRDGKVTYELEGGLGGKEYEVLVSADGKVVEVEEDTD